MEMAATSTLKRERLHNIIDIIDEEKINAMLVLFDEVAEGNRIYSDEFTEEDIKVFDERRLNRLSGKSKVYSWAEAKEMITSKKQAK
jgi:hypothetical protein